MSAVAPLPVVPPLSEPLVRELAALREPVEVLQAVTELFPERLAIASSLGPQTLVVVDLLHRMGRSVPVFFLDTGLLFPETYALRMRVQHRYGLDVRGVTPRQSVAEQAATEGDELWRRDTDRCCALRKVAPLRDALDGLDAWITGLRRDQSDTRAATETFGWDAKHGLWKVNPLAHWDQARTMAYLRAHDVPYNALLDQGYRSVGCAPCTRPVAQGDDERAGRWAWSGKTECGLHLP